MGYLQAKHQVFLSRLQLASANRVAVLTSRDGILWVQGIPNVKYTWAPQTVHNTPVMNIRRLFLYDTFLKETHLRNQRQILNFS